VTFLRYCFLAGIRLASRIFYGHDSQWVGERPAEPFRNVRLAALLNHTSLFEIALSGSFPLHFVREISERALLPGADTTMDRPLVGRIFKWMVPKSVTLTRRKDSSWERFLSAIDAGTIVLLFPEGRMRRRGGFDKHGRPMTVRGGIADVLERIDDGDLLLVYSEGLHHVHAAGDRFPSPFQQVRCRFEQIPIRRYKELMGVGDVHFARNVMHDLEKRRDEHCLWDEKSVARGGPIEIPLHYPRPPRGDA
jgi:hypothetical protein